MEPRAETGERRDRAGLHGPPEEAGGPRRRRRVLVAGGTGFLGAAIVRELRARDHPVVVLSRRPERVAERFPGLDVEGRPGDVRRPETLREALRDVEVAVVSVQFQGFPVEDPRRHRTFMEVDAGGTRNLVAAAAETGVGRLVYLSGVGADPASRRPWFRAKGIAEGAVRDSGIPHVIVRPSWVYGPEDRSLNRFAGMLRVAPVFPQLGRGTQRLNPVFVGDVARLAAAAVEEDRLSAETVEIGGPVTYTMDDIVRLVMEATGRRRPIVHLPLGMARAGAALVELLPGRAISRDAIRFVVQDAVADTGPLRRLFPELRLTPMPEALRGYMRPG